MIVGTLAMPTEFVNDEDNTVPVKTVAQFTEGFLYGILHHEVPAVDACITNVNAIWIHVTNAMTDFNKKSFDGVSSGLSELSGVSRKFQLLSSTASKTKTTSQSSTK